MVNDDQCQWSKLMVNVNGQCWSMSMVNVGPMSMVNVDVQSRWSTSMINVLVKVYGHWSMSMFNVDGQC